MQRKKQGKRAKPSGQRPTGRKAKGGSQRSMGGPQRNIQAIPSAIGGVYPQAFIKRGGTAQQVTDQDPAGSERITGCDLFSLPIVLGDVTDTSTGGFGGTYWATVSPNVISARLAAIEEMYQWWAIRDLKVHYTPVIGTGTAGSIAIGISTDHDTSVAFSAPTQQEIMELQPAMLCPVWGMASMELKFRGTKLYESYASSESSDTRFQAAIGAVFDVNGSIAAGVPRGQLWLTYTIDFYQQSPLLSAVDLVRLNRLCPRCRQPVDLKRVIPRTKTIERKSALPDRDDGFVVLRTQEPSTGVFQGLQTYQGLESPPIRREESKAHLTARSQSQKG